MDGMRKVSKNDQLRCGFRFNKDQEKIIYIKEGNVRKEVVVLDDSDEEFFLIRDLKNPLE
jgi:hypothetical protein